MLTDGRPAGERAVRFFRGNRRVPLGALARMARVFVTRGLPGPALERLAAAHAVEVWPHEDAPPRERLLDRAAGAEGLLTMLTDSVDRELLEAAPGLRVVSNCAVGLDNVDLGAARERGVTVGHTPDVLTGSTADLAVALMLAAARRLREGIDSVVEGRWGAWSPTWMLGRDLHQATVGIVGRGRIGEAVARRLTGFGCEVVHTARTSTASDEPGLVALDELLERSDFVTLHCPLTDETRGLIGERALARMKPTAYLVNTARGPIVDQAALRSALERGEIAGAALDVTDPEPLPPGDPLLEAPNLTVLPHLGSATHRTREAMAELAVENLMAGLAGEPLPAPAP